MSHGIFQKSTKTKTWHRPYVWHYAFQRAFKSPQVANSDDLWYHKDLTLWRRIPEWTALPASLDAAMRKTRADENHRERPTLLQFPCAISPCHFSTCQTQNQVPSISFCRLAIRSSRVSTCAEHMDRPINLQVTIPWLLGGTLLRELRQVPRDMDPL